MIKPLISVVIPTYNRPDKLNRLLESLNNIEYPTDKLEIIVVDDASEKGIYDTVCRHFQEIIMIRNNEKRFLAGSRNIGVKYSKGELIFLVDDDNVLDCRCVNELVELMKSYERVGIAGPITYYLHEPKKILFAGVKRNLLTGRTIFVGKGEEDLGQYQYPIVSDDIPNAFMVRREIFDKIGFFDEERFPIHYDEADFGMRVRHLGYKILIVPKAKIYHETPSTYRGRFQPTRTYYAVRNKIVFHRKYLKTLQFITFLLAFSPLFLAYYCIKTGQISTCIAANMDGLTGKDRVRLQRKTQFSRVK
jgi:hypothetical protein